MVQPGRDVETIVRVVRAVDDEAAELGPRPSPRRLSGAQAKSVGEVDGVPVGKVEADEDSLPRADRTEQQLPYVRNRQLPRPWVRELLGRGVADRDPDAVLPGLRLAAGAPVDEEAVEEPNLADWRASAAGGRVEALARAHRRSPSSAGSVFTVIPVL